MDGGRHSQGMTTTTTLVETNGTRSFRTPDTDICREWPTIRLLVVLLPSVVGVEGWELRDRQREGEEKREGYRVEVKASKWLVWVG